MEQENSLVVVSPMDLLAQAVEKGADLDKLEKLMDLQDRWESKQARKAFLSAMSQFQSLVPEIKKLKTVDFVGKQGGRVHYNYASLDIIAKQIRGPLQECGLSYRYQTENLDTGVKVTCVVSHKDGHSEENSIASSLDTSGNKNAIQQVGSTMTYLQRYSLIGALGISTAEDDNDGQTPAGESVPKAIQNKINSFKDSEDLLSWAADQAEYHKQEVFRALVNLRQNKIENSKKKGDKK